MLKTHNDLNNYDLVTKDAPQSNHPTPAQGRGWVHPMCVYITEAAEKIPSLLHTLSLVRRLHTARCSKFAGGLSLKCIII